MPTSASPDPDRQPPSDPPVPWRRTAVAVVTAAMAGALWAVAARDPASTETWYSEAIFPHVARALVALSGWLPFSLGETLLLGALVVAVAGAARSLVLVVRRRRRLGNVLARGLGHLLGAAAVVFTAFVLLWGINHARPTFAELAGMTVRPVTRDALLHTLEKLAQRAAAARPAGFDAEAPLPAGWEACIGDAYAAAGVDCALLRGPRPVVRTPWISSLMTLASTTGIYSPFTGEPHVNGTLLAPERLFVACHEVAHLRGFAREDEANFIAWRVGSRAADRALAYACELQALRYVRGALSYGAGILDPAAQTVLARVPQVMADITAIERFWRRERERALHGAVSAVASATNDLYLKSAGHADGARSYGRMVDLLVAALAD